MSRKKSKRKSHKIKTSSQHINVSVKIDRPVASRNMQLISVPHFASDDKRSLIPISPEGLPGKYAVIFITCIPGKEFYHTDIDVNRLMNSGDSMLFLSPSAHLIINSHFNGQNIDINVIPNNEGRLSKLQASVHAQNFFDAQKIAYEAIMPFLNHCSYLYDVPLDISGFEIIEELTGSKKWSFEALGQYKSIDTKTIDTALSKETRAILATYREGLISTNVFYKFISFYKVTEGIKEIKKIWVKSLDKEKIKELFPRQKFPDVDHIPTITEEDLIEFFIPYAGQWYSTVIDNFRGLFRNSLAHLNPGSDDIELDKFDDVNSCIRAVHVLKYIVREMISNLLRAENIINQENLTI